MQNAECTNNSKGITAVIGIILLVAVAVILIVIVSVFFIGFTGNTSRDVQKSAPSIQVLSGSNCLSTKGVFKLDNQLNQDIKVGDLVTVIEDTKHLGFFEVVGADVRAGQTEDLTLRNIEGDKPPMVYKEAQQYTLKFTSGAAAGQDIPVTCSLPSNYFKLTRGSIDDNTLKIEATQTIYSNGSSSSCQNTTNSGRLTAWSGVGYLSGGADNATNYCLNTTLAVGAPGSKTTFENVGLLQCNNVNCTIVDLTQDLNLILRIEDEDNSLQGQASRLVIGR